MWRPETRSSNNQMRSRCPVLHYLGGPVSHEALPIPCAIYTRQPVATGDDLSSCQVQYELCHEFVSAHALIWMLSDDASTTTEFPELRSIVPLSSSS